MRHVLAALLVLALGWACTLPGRRAVHGLGLSVLLRGAPVLSPETVEAQGGHLDRLLPKTDIRWGWSADEAYRLAERFYQATDFEKAGVFTRRALRLDPSHAPAQALLIEIQYVTGRRPFPPTHPGVFLDKNVVEAQMMLIDVDHALARAERNLRLGRIESAALEYRSVREYLKWIPDGIELRARRAQLDAGLRRLETLQGPVPSE